MTSLPTYRRVNQFLEYTLSSLAGLYELNIEDIQFYFKDLEKDLKSVEKQLKNEYFFIPVRSDLKDLTSSLLNLFNLIKERYIDITKEFKSYKKRYQALQKHMKLKDDSPVLRINQAVVACKNFIIALGEEVELSIKLLNGLISKSSYIKLEAENFISNLGGFQQLPKKKETKQLEQFYGNLMKAWRATHLNKRINEFINLQKSLKNALKDLSD